MRFSNILTTCFAASLATAATIKGTPALYARAEVTSRIYNIEAHFEFWGFLDGKTGTFVKVNVLKGLISNSTVIDGPFLYHVHTNAVGKAQNCTTALAHLDPLNVTESLICDPAFPQYCQEGDLSGKHGTLNATSTGAIESFGYSDDYLRFFPADFSLLGRSVVIHSSNKTRLACGDIISTLDGTATSSYTPTYKPSKFVKKYPSVAAPNPPQVVTPFLGTNFPDNSTLQGLPFPLPNPAIPIWQSLNVQLGTQNQTVFVNGSQTTATLPVESPSSSKVPFKANTYVF